jgi:hypothetical protein
MTEIPDIYLDLLLQKKAFAHLAAVMADGSPQNTPVWFDYTDGKIRVNSALGRTKVRNMTGARKWHCPSWIPTTPIVTSSCAAP